MDETFDMWYNRKTKFDYGCDFESCWKADTAASGKEQKEGGNASLAFNTMASFIGTGMNKGGNSPKVDAIATPIINALDIAGYNYGSGRYASTVWGLEKAPRIAVRPVNHPGVRPSKSVWPGTNAIESWAWSG